MEEGSWKAANSTASRGLAQATPTPAPHQSASTRNYSTDARTGAAPALVLSAGPSPSPGLERLHQHNKTRGSLWPSLAALPAAPGPGDLKASSPVTAAHGGEANTGAGGGTPAWVGIKLQAARGGEWDPASSRG